VSTPPQEPIPVFLSRLLADDAHAFLNGRPGPSELFDYKVALDGLLDVLEQTVGQVRQAAVALVNESFVG